MSELAADIKDLATHKVEGFSGRFNDLLDRARVPQRNRVAFGAERFGVAPNTFRSWGSNDKVPSTHAVLISIVDSLLKQVPGHHNTRSVTAWLLAGDAVPNPFAEDTGALTLVELYIQISDVAHQEGHKFDELPRDVRNLILNHVRSVVRPDANGEYRLDDAAVALVKGMLATHGLAQCLPR